MTSRMGKKTVATYLISFTASIIFFRIKSGLLDALTRETDISVRNSTAQVVASIAKHELADRKWPELLEFIQQLCCQGKSNEKELGLYILSIVADSAGGEFKIFLKPFVSIFHSALQDSNPNSAYYAGIALKNLIPSIGSDEAVRLNLSKSYQMNNK